MRDAFGGIFMIRLFLVFIIIYVAFTAVSLNYAKAFKIKNSVISFIEENELVSLDKLNDQNVSDKLNQILKNANYNKSCNNGNSPIKSDSGAVIGYCYNGIVILQKDKIPIKNEKNKTIAYRITYQVTAYADWNIGMLNKILVLGGQQENSQEYVTGTWAINGEAKLISKE